MSINLIVRGFDAGSGLSYNNAIYVNAQSYKKTGPYLGYKSCVFSVFVSPEVPPDTVCINGPSRIMMRCKLGDQLPFTKVDIKTFVPVDQIQIEIDYLGNAKTITGELDQKYLKSLLDILDNYPLCAGQVYVIGTHTEKFRIRVMSMTRIDPKLISPAGIVQDIPFVNVDKGLYKHNITAVTFAPFPGSDIQIEKSDEDSIFKTTEINFEQLGIGGMDKEFKEILRRAFASRMLSQDLIKQLGVKHVMGIIMHGPPGCGKTLLAGQIGQMLNARKLKVVNGPSLLNKYVGASEENARLLFKEAEEEYAAKGDKSGLHIIVFDEFDSIGGRRSGGGDTGADVANKVVNTLLSKIDGIDRLNNVLLIGLTNRFDLLDDALIRPGRFECHIEVGLPDETGRQEILQIHTAAFKSTGIMNPDISVRELAIRTKNYTGAELAAVARCALTYAIMREVDMKHINTNIGAIKTQITKQDFDLSLDEIRPVFGIDNDNIKDPENFIVYSDNYRDILNNIQSLITQLKQSKRINIRSVLVEGSIGSGKSTLASKIAINSDCAYIKKISPESLLSSTTEAGKCARISKVFNDSYKSETSIIILDNIERLIEYVNIGSRFSNNILQTLMTFISRDQPQSKDMVPKLFIIGTTASSRVLKSLGITELFSDIVRLPDLNSNETANILHAYTKLSNCKPDNLNLNMSLNLPASIPIKKLLMIIDRIMLPGSSDDPLKYFDEYNRKEQLIGKLPGVNDEDPFDF